MSEKDETAIGIFARICEGRGADGKRIGDDPDLIKFLADLAGTHDPDACVLDDDEIIQFAKEAGLPKEFYGAPISVALKRFVNLVTEETIRWHDSLGDDEPEDLD